NPPRPFLGLNCRNEGIHSFILELRTTPNLDRLRACFFRDGAEGLVRQIDLQDLDLAVPTYELVDSAIADDQLPGAVGVVEEFIAAHTMLVSARRKYFRQRLLMLHIVGGLALDGAFKMLQLQAVAARVQGDPPVARSLRIPPMSKAYAYIRKHCL